MAGTMVPSGSDFFVIGLGKGQTLMLVAILIVVVVLVWRARSGGKNAVAG